tara:strand:+ start:1065 stop:2954 length:1890 start_codon:yes stop_codon:yes gene_type:complete
MSLVILSNTQEEYTRRDDNNFVIASGNGVSSPQSFINHFRSPLVIEPNSEVAVESVKINRGPLFDVDDTNLFYLYYGRELVNVNACESTKEPVPIRISRGSYTVKSMAQALERAVNRAPMNPDVWNKYKVTVNLNASDSSSFVNFKFNQVSNTTTPADISWTGADDEIQPANPVTDINNLTWESPGTLTLDAQDDDPLNDGSVILPKYPLSSCSGVFEVDFSNAAGYWDIGLSRSTVANYLNGQPPNINTWASRDVDWEPFYDYVVKWDGVNIRLYHAITGAPGQKNDTDISVQEIEYWDNTGSKPYFTDIIESTKISASGLDSVKFTLIGNGMEVSVGDGTLWYPLSSPIDTNLNNTDRRYNCKPTNNATEALYPKLALYTIADELTVETYNGLDQDGWLAPDDDYVGRSFVPGSDWYSNQVMTNPRRVRFIDGRDACRAYNASDTTYTYSLLNASNSPDYNMVLIPGPERDLTTKTQPNIAFTSTYAIGFGQQANMAQVLGSGDISVLEQSVYGSGNLNSIFITPPVKSEFMTHSGFIRVNNLTGVSYNGTKGSISKILYQIPRFDNSGRTEGNLYFSPGEKTYIELGNTEQLILNQLDVDIVDKSERVVSDLIGSTVVVLYIRKVR